jgi:hypothetical protein
MQLQWVASDRRVSMAGGYVQARRLMMTERVEAAGTGGSLKANASVRVCPEAFVSSMRGEMEQTLREVAAAVNAAPDGAWIEGSEHQVREVMGRLRQRVFERATQMRIDAAEAAFSPSAQRGDGASSGGQGA